MLTIKSPFFSNTYSSQWDLWELSANEMCIFQLVATLFDPHYMWHIFLLRKWTSSIWGVLSFFQGKEDNAGFQFPLRGLLNLEWTRYIKPLKRCSRPIFKPIWIWRVLYMSLKTPSLCWNRKEIGTMILWQYSFVWCPCKI